MRNSKIALFCLLLTLLVIPALAQSKEFSQTVPFSPGDRLSMDTYKGSIHITPWDRSEVSIFARIEPPENEDAGYAAEVVEATRVEVRRSGGRLTIHSDYSDVPYKHDAWWSRSRNLSFVHYEIQAPRNLDLRIDDYKSDIEVYDLSGEINLETYKGTIKASNLDGRLRLETYKGRGDLDGLTGRLDVETYKGEIALQAVEINGDSRLETYKGNIRLQVPERQGFELIADLGRRASLKGNLVESVSSRNSRDRAHFRGGINQGGPRLAVSSHKGDIRISGW